MFTVEEDPDLSVEAVLLLQSEQLLKANFN